jgi:hypothetical protein
MAQDVERALFDARIFDLQSRQEEGEQRVRKHVTCIEVVSVSCAHNEH